MGISWELFLPLRIILSHGFYGCGRSSSLFRLDTSRLARCIQGSIRLFGSRNASSFGSLAIIDVKIKIWWKVEAPDDSVVMPRENLFFVVVESRRWKRTAVLVLQMRIAAVVSHL